MVYNKSALENAVGNHYKKCPEFDHNAHHGFRVYSLARKIAELEKIAFDDDILHPASYLHDIGYTVPACWNDLEKHPFYSARIAEDWLRKEQLQFPQEKIPAVLEIIKTHDAPKCYAVEAKLYGDTNIIEGKLLQDADRLDGFGVIGMLRILANDQRMGKVFFDPALSFSDKSSSQKSFVHNLRYHLEFNGKMNFQSAEAMMLKKKMDVWKVFQILHDELNPKR